MGLFRGVQRLSALAPMCAKLSGVKVNGPDPPQNGPDLLRMSPDPPQNGPDLPNTDPDLLSTGANHPHILLNFLQTGTDALRGGSSYRFSCSRLFSTDETLLNFQLSL